MLLKYSLVRVCLIHKPVVQHNRNNQNVESWPRDLQARGCYKCGIPEPSTGVYEQKARTYFAGGIHPVVHTRIRV